MIPRLARLYISLRGLISDSRLKNQTLLNLRKFQERVHSTPQQQMEAASPTGKWNAMEITFHAINTNKNILRTCDDLRTKQDVPDSPRNAAGRTRIVSRDDLLALMQRVYETTERFDFRNEKTKTYGHPYLGQFNFHQWLVINLIHLERHYRQLDRLLSS